MRVFHQVRNIHEVAVFNELKNYAAFAVLQVEAYM